MRRPTNVLGVLLAGGESRRYGSPKALAVVDGTSILDRGVAALRQAAGDPVIVANDPGPYLSTGLPIRPDVRPGSGVLGGILTAVGWAAEVGFDAALVLACDMPFVAAPLLHRLTRSAGPPYAVLPESEGPRGLEPLCAAYGVGCLGAIERALDRGDRAVISFFDDIEVRRIPLDEVRQFGDPERLFYNVNRPEERRRAESLARLEARDPDEGD